MNSCRQCKYAASDGGQNTHVRCLAASHDEAADIRRGLIGECNSFEPKESPSDPAGYQDTKTTKVIPTTADCENALRNIAKEEGLDLKGKLIVAEARQTEFRNDAIRLADALMDINNLVGEDEHVKQAVARIDVVMREYAGLEFE